MALVSFLNPFDFLKDYLSSSFSSEPMEYDVTPYSEFKEQEAPFTSSSILGAVLDYIVSSSLRSGRTVSSAPALAEAPPQPFSQAVVPTQSFTSTPASVKNAPPRAPIVTGDSVATGIGHGGRRGTESSEAQWGRGSAAQLQFMLNKGPDYYRGRDIVLSSGALNSQDLGSVDRQLKFLRDSGARSVRLAGAPLHGRLSYLNNPLKKLADKYGFSFLGGYESRDAVHPANYATYGR